MCGVLIDGENGRRMQRMCPSVWVTYCEKLLYRHLRRAVATRIPEDTCYTNSRFFSDSFVLATTKAWG